MPRWCALFIVIFLLGHGICRGLTWNHLEYDEAEQLVLVQSLEWGYYYQPPLYTWLLWPWVKLLGPTVFPLLIVRTLLYAILFRLMFAIARRVTLSDQLAALVALSTVLVPEVFHGAIGMWPHTLLMTVCILATLLLTLRLVENKTTGDYLLLGIGGGLGMLSKYNYAHWVAAWGLAMLLLPRWRGVLCDRRLALSLLVACIILAPHAWWMTQHLDEVRHGVVRYTEEKQNQFSSVWASIKHIGTNIVQNLGRSNGFILLPLLLIFVPLWKGTQRNEEAVPELRRLLLRFYLIGAVLLVAAMILGGVHHIRQHWLTGFAILLPLLVLANVDARKLKRWQWRSFAGVILVAGIGALAWRGFLLYHYSEAGCLSARSYQYAQLREELQQTTWNQETAVVDHPYSAAYLRLHFPQTRVHCLYFPSLVQPQAEEQLLVSWRARPNQATTRMKDTLFQRMVRPGARSQEPGARSQMENVNHALVVEEPAGRLLSDNVRVHAVVIDPPSSVVVPVHQR
jgi:lipopolysaccharide core galacturonosyltransferase RgtB